MYGEPTVYAQPLSEFEALQLWETTDGNRRHWAAAWSLSEAIETFRKAGIQPTWTKHVEDLDVLEHKHASAAILFRKVRSLDPQVSGYTPPCILYSTPAPPTYPSSHWGPDNCDLDCGDDH